MIGTWGFIGTFAYENQGQQQIVLGVNQTGCKLCIDIIDLVDTEAFRQLDLDFAYNLYPLKRSLLEPNTGRLDGETARLEFDAEMEKRYPNLIQVNESIGEITVTAYAASSSIQIEGMKAD